MEELGDLREKGETFAKASLPAGLLVGVNLGELFEEEALELVGGVDEIGPKSSVVAILEGRVFAASSCFTIAS